MNEPAECATTPPAPATTATLKEVRIMATADLTPARDPLHLPDRVAVFWSRVNKAGPVPPHRPELGPCWLWTGAPGAGGYGRIGVGRKSIPAHRFAYEDVNGPLPSGVLACHKCDNPSCVRPDHLFPGTSAENSRDMVSKGRQARGDHVPPERRARGERVTLARITAASVLAIVADHQAGLSMAAIGSRYGICASSVCNILRGKTWRHVARPFFAVGRGNYATNGLHQRRASSAGSGRL